MSFSSLSFSQAIYLDVDPEVASIVASLGDATALVAGAGSIADASSVSSLTRYTADSIGAGVGAAIAAIQADVGNPSIRTNLKSLEAMLGCPDLAASSINDLMAKEGADGDTLETLSDQLDSVALETTLGGLITTVGVAGAGLTAIGDTRMSYLDASIAAISLVVPDAAGTAAGIIGVAGASLTAIGDTRMGYLDASIAAISLVVPDVAGTAAGLHGTTDGLIGAINDTETSSLHGKLGTDTEMADTSVFDMITANRTALETASLGVAGGSLAANAREGSLLRYAADTADTVMDTIGVAGAGLTAIGDTRMAYLDASVAAISLVVPDVAGTAAGLHGTTDGKIDSLDTVVDNGFIAIQATADDIQANVGTISNTTLADTLSATLGDFVATPLVDRLDNIQDRLGGTGNISSMDYIDAGGEQTVLEIVPGAALLEVNSIFLDLVNMTENGTIKVYLKIDGSTYRELFSDSFVVATDSDGSMDRLQSHD
jgi:hypothetical protein